MWVFDRLRLTAWRVKSTAWRVKCGSSTGSDWQREEWSVKREAWSVKCEVWSVKSKVWSVGLRQAQTDSVKCVSSSAWVCEGVSRTLERFNELLLDTIFLHCISENHSKWHTIIIKVLAKINNHNVSSSAWVCEGVSRTVNSNPTLSLSTELRTGSVEMSLRGVLTTW